MGGLDVNYLTVSTLGMCMYILLA